MPRRHTLPAALWGLLWTELIRETEPPLRRAIEAVENAAPGIDVSRLPSNRLGP